MPGIRTAGNLYLSSPLPPSPLHPSPNRPGHLQISMEIPSFGSANGTERGLPTRPDGTLVMTSGEVDEGDCVEAPLEMEPLCMRCYENVSPASPSPPPHT